MKKKNKKNNDNFSKVHRMKDDVTLAEAQAAFQKMREAAKRSGLDKMPLKEINAIIEEVRAEMRKKRVSKKENKRHN